MNSVIHSVKQPFYFIVYFGVKCWPTIILFLETDYALMINTATLVLPGLQHSSVARAVMSPYFQGYSPHLRLHEDDIKAVTSLYGIVLLIIRIF